MNPASEDAGTVYIVDDDAAVRDGLDSLLRSVGYAVRCFGSADVFVVEPEFERPACIVLDIRMPGRSGMDLQAELGRRGVAIPIVFLTGHGDVAMCVQAMKAGAIDFLLKPFAEAALLGAIHSAVETDRLSRGNEAALRALQSRHATLTPREREVMALVVAGLLNKQIAARLGLSEIAIKVNRGRAMRKMAANSVADLVRMAERLSPRTRTAR